jgi:hypothetical protein
MTERDKILMMQVLLSFVDDIHKGKPHPGPFSIRNRLRRYDENLDQLLSQAKDS